jgi:hypothetical protein
MIFAPDVLERLGGRTQSTGDGFREATSKEPSLGQSHLSSETLPAKENSRLQLLFSGQRGLVSPVVSD